MARRKYQFSNRAEAEANWQRAENGRLRNAWLASALFNGTATHTEQIDRYQVGYFVLPYSAYVYVLRRGERVYSIASIGDALEPSECEGEYAFCWDELAELPAAVKRARLTAERELFPHAEAAEAAS